MEKRTPDAARAISLTDQDCARLSTLYDGRFAEHGIDVRTVGWGSQQGQFLRFEVLCRGLSLEGMRVLDIGCGLGDFVPWAEQRYGKNFDYVGVDLAADLIRSARSRLGGPRRKFISDTLGPENGLGEFNVIVLSGTLTFKTSDNLATMRSLLSNAYVQCKGVLCANFMSAYADSQLEKNFHYSPEQVFAFAKTLSPHVTLYHDYPLYEFTIQISRQPNLAPTESSKP